MDVTASAPGKLLLVGEYAVISRRPAIGVAVTRRLRCLAQSGRGDGALVLRSGAHSCRLRLWDAEPDEAPPELRFMAAAALIAGRDLALRGLDIELETESDLDPIATKTGLGGSAAATAATVAALHGLAGREVGPSTLGRRALTAVLAHRLAQGGGSAVDAVIASVGGLVWIEDLDARDRPRSVPDALARLAASSPPRFHRLMLPSGLALEVGWTGRPCRSAPRANRFAERLGGGPEDVLLAAWMDGVRAVSEELAAGCDTGSAARVLAAVRAGGRHLGRLAALVGIPIWTPELRRACRVATGCDAAAKPSGAGGGDCVIAVARAERRLELRDAWAKVGVEPLSLAIDPEGSRLDAVRESNTDG